MSDENCIVDFCGRCPALGEPVSFWADFDPIAKVVRFGGWWSNVPDMPAEDKPSENEVEAWEQAHPSILTLRLNAWRKKETLMRKRSDALQKLFTEKIGNCCSVELINSRGSLVKYGRNVGIMTAMQCLRGITFCLQDKNNRYYGYRIKSFRFIKNISDEDISKLPQLTDFKLCYASIH